METSDIKTSDNAPRLDFIDGLRGVAILMVLMTHAWVSSGAPALSFRVYHLTILLATIPAVGNIGVNLFLVLSGFCLAYPFMRNPAYRQKMTVQEFWRKRIRRIVPAYYISIICVILFSIAFSAVIRLLPSHLLVGKPTISAALPSVEDLLAHMFFVHNLSGQFVSSINGSYWSLALEFQLYLFFPLFIELFFRWGPWKTLLVILALQLIIRFCIYYSLPNCDATNLQFVLPKSVFGRMLDFYLGIMSAYFVATGINRPIYKISAGVGSTILLATAFTLRVIRFSPSSPVYDLLWAFGFALLIYYGSCQGTACHRVLCYKPLVGLGVASYSVYLIHQPLIERGGFLLSLFFRPGLSYILLTFIVTPMIVALGILYFRSIEAPILQRNRKLPTTEKTLPIVAEGVA